MAVPDDELDREQPASTHSFIVYNPLQVCQAVTFKRGNGAYYLRDAEMNKLVRCMNSLDEHGR